MLQADTGAGENRGGGGAERSQRPPDLRTRQHRLRSMRTVPIWIFNEQIEVAERTVGWRRIMGGGASRALQRRERAHGRLAGTGLQRSPDPGGCEPQMMLPQRVDARLSLGESSDHAGKPDVTVGARLFEQFGWGPDVSEPGVPAPGPHAPNR